MTIFIAILLTLLTFAFVTYPFFRRQQASLVGAGEDERLEELYSKRDTAYSMLKELEFDYESGSLTDDDYQDLETIYKKKAISLLRDIDGLEKGTEVEDEIEKQILALRRGKGRFCPQCGTRCQDNDRFCSRCGTSLKPGRAT